MKGETTMAKQPTRSASKWRNTVIAVVTLIAGFTASAAQAALTPVYRFYHLDAGRHFYTASEAEKTKILTDYPVYAYEGIAYYAQAGSGGESVPLYRLYNTKLGTHFFTTSLSEANSAVAAWPWFVLEGAIYYVQSTGGATANQSPTVSLVASATSGKIGDVVKLTATANDSDGSISKVEFYKDADKIGETTSAPHLLSY